MANSGDLKRAQKLYALIDVLQEFRFVNTTGPVSVLFGEFGEHAVQIKSADPLSVIKDLALEQVDRQIADAKRELTKLGYEA